MIPKKIHYCWFGRNPKPKLFEKCLKSWKKYCPDYEIIEWNEDNFDVNSNLYTKQAYETKKWAFVTDYVRLYVLYNYGGIYMDTDVEVIKPLDEFLKHKAFSGFEDQENVGTGIMASEKELPIFKMLLDYYNDRQFLIDGIPDVTTNVVTITKLLKEHGFVPNNQLQTVCDFTLYPNDYFCPQNYHTHEIVQTTNTYTIHHFAGSWLPDTTQKKLDHYYKRDMIRRLLGERIARSYDTFYFSKVSNGGDGVLKWVFKALYRRINKMNR